MSFPFADVLDQLSIIVAIHLGVEGTRITGSPVVVSFYRTFESDKVENVVQPIDLRRTSLESPLPRLFRLDPLVLLRERHQK